MKLNIGIWQNAVTSAEAGLKEAMVNVEMFSVTLAHAKKRLDELEQEAKL